MQLHFGSWKQAQREKYARANISTADLTRNNMKNIELPTEGVREIESKRRRKNHETLELIKKIVYTKHNKNAHTVKKQKKIDEHKYRIKCYTGEQSAFRKRDQRDLR